MSDSDFYFENRFLIALRVSRRGKRVGGGRGYRLRTSRQRCVGRCVTDFWDDHDLADAFHPWELGRGISNAIDVI